MSQCMKHLEQYLCYYVIMIMAIFDVFEKDKLDKVEI